MAVNVVHHFVLYTLDTNYLKVIISLLSIQWGGVCVGYKDDLDMVSIDGMQNYNDGD